MTVPEKLDAILGRAQAVLFDMDGPLCAVFAGLPAPTVASKLRTFLDAGQLADLDAGYTPGDPLEVLRYVGQLDRRQLVRRIEDALIPAEVEAIRVAAPTAGGGESIRACSRAGLRVAVVTNNAPEAASAYLASRGLDRHVDAVVGRTYARPDLMKPNPDPLRRALDALGISPASAVLLGDSVADLEASRAAGTWCVGYANRPSKRDALARADVTIEDMSVLAAAIGRLAESSRSSPGAA